MTPTKFPRISPDTTDSVVVKTSKGFKGTVVQNNHEAEIEIGTSVTGIAKGDGNSLSSATPKVDYATPDQIPLSFSSTVAGGSGYCTFTMTDGSGNALFPNLQKKNLIFSTESQAAYGTDQITIAADKKTVTVRFSYAGLSALVVAYFAAENGLVTYLNVNPN